MISAIKSRGNGREDHLISMTLFSFLTTPLLLLAIAAGVSAF